MFKNLRQHKVFLVGVMIVGIILFSTTHTVAMNDHMNGKSCLIQSLCSGCAVPVVTPSPEIFHTFSVLEILAQPGVMLPELNEEPLFHPPR